MKGVKYIFLLFMISTTIILLPLVYYYRDLLLNQSSSHVKYESDPAYLEDHTNNSYNIEILDNNTLSGIDDSDIETIDIDNNLNITFVSSIKNSNIDTAIRFQINDFEINDIDEYQQKLLEDNGLDKRTDEGALDERAYIKDHIISYYDQYKRRFSIFNNDYDFQKSVKLFLNNLMNAEEFLDYDNPVVFRLKAFLNDMKIRLNSILEYYKGYFLRINAPTVSVKSFITSRIYNYIEDVGVFISPHDYVFFRHGSYQKLKIFYPEIYKVYKKIICEEADMKIQEFLRTNDN